MHARNDRYELRALLGIWDPAINKATQQIASYSSSMQAAGWPMIGPSRPKMHGWDLL